MKFHKGQSLTDPKESWRQPSRWQSVPRWLDWRLNKTMAKISGQSLRHDVALFWGQEMTVVYPEYVSGQIGRRGFFESDVTSALVELLDQGDVFYDVGSHFGFHSLLAASIVGPEGCVYAFEPTPATFEVLSKNASRMENIHPQNLAIFSHSTVIDFWTQDVRDSAMNFVVIDSSDSGDPQVQGNQQIHKGNKKTIPAVSLDEFTRTHRDPSVVKLDVEGVESQVLEGMTETIHRCRPVICLEVGDNIKSKTGNQSCRENVNFLMGLGYQPFEFSTTGRRPHQVQDQYAPGNLIFLPE